MSKIYIGQRLSFDGALCTVRYVGTVEGTKGEWLGVEWDDPARGKHGGDHGGKTYFICLRPSPTSASFVRPNRTPDPPRTFLEALKYKYAPDLLYDSGLLRQGPGQVELMKPRKPIHFGTKEAEEVGFEKIARRLAHLEELRFVILDGLTVSRRHSALERATAEELIHDTCPKVTELDLSRNLFEEWREVVEICEQLDRLSSLRINGNRFREISLTPEQNQQSIDALNGIRSLSVDDTLLSWPRIASLSHTLRDIIILSASNNLLKQLTPDPLPTTITELILEDNEFQDLSDIAPVATVPALRRLVLRFNLIGSTERDSTVESVVFSRSLTTLDLSHNQIDNWSFINSLPTHFPGLTSLRVSHNPLYNSLTSPTGASLSADTGYLLTTARLGALQTLNYSTITSKDRLDAESYYLSLIHAEIAQAPTEKRGRVLCLHPRYDELREEYGGPVAEQKKVDGNENTLGARLLLVKVRLGEDVQVELKKINREDLKAGFVIKIPRSFTIYNTLGQIGKKLGLPPVGLRLFWETGEWDEVIREEAEEEEWDSDEDGAGKDVESVQRVIELVAGTRLVGTWIEGNEMNIRVEMEK